LQKSLKLETYISLTSIGCQSSLPIAAAVHSPSVNSPPHQLPTTSPYFFPRSFAYQYLYLHILICSSITPVLIAKL
jgi:hypothetical protein